MADRHDGTSSGVAIATGGHRWTARATSVAGIEQELARIWGAAARESHEAHLSEKEVALARGDPHLAGLLDEPGELNIRMRTSVLTLVVVAERPETAERALDAVNELSSRHPSRALVISPGDPDGPAWMDASIYAQCRISERSRAETCTEQILLKTGGEMDAHLAELVQPLLIHDLPVVLWWPDDPPVGRHRFLSLLRTCDRLLVDSGSFTGDGLARLTGLVDVCSTGTPIVHDIGWMRLTLWRELLAELFDHPLLTPELSTARTLRLDVLRPGAELRLAKPALYAGWLATVLGWQVAEPLTPQRGRDTLVGSFRSARGEVSVELRPVSPSGESGGRRAGSLARVELEMGGRGRAVRARVTRHADHLLATADWAGAEVARRAGRREPFGEAPYVGEALDRAGQDRLLARAMTTAVQLLGGPHAPAARTSGVAPD
jgi:glucose-6-phosphate dehydrogenase assembly protein OpcA